jgi:RND family efflux transporter MFP subunit
LAQQRQVELAEAGVQSAQVQLGYCTVLAPFSGVVIATSAQVGEIVSPLSAGGGFTRTGIGTLVDMGSLEIEVDVNEASIHRIVAGQAVEAELNAYPGWMIPSHVIAIIPTADRTKATVKVRVGMNLRDHRILPDMGVRVSFMELTSATSPPQPSPGVLVPTSAVQRAGEQFVAFVLKDYRAQRRVITLGDKVDGARHILTGISAGETVIVDASTAISDGTFLRAAN